MKEVKICKYCKSVIDDKAKICPYCHSKQGDNKPIIIIISTLVTLFFIGFLIGLVTINKPTKKSKKANIDITISKIAMNTNDETEEKTTTDIIDNSQKETQPKTPTELKESYSVGEIASSEVVDATLTNVTECNGSDSLIPSKGNIYVVCEFEIKNQSKTDMLINSQHCFQTLCDGAPVVTSTNASKASKKAQRLDNILHTGDTLKGYLAYEVPNTYKNIEITFKPVGQGKLMKFKYTKQ